MREPFNPPRVTRGPLLTIRVHPTVPLTPAVRGYIGLMLGTLAAEYAKGEHLTTRRYQVLRPGDETAPAPG